MKLFDTFKKIHGFKSEIRTLARAYTDSRTPLWTKLTIAIGGLIYIVSPVDLLPNFLLPLLGISDDLLIVPVLMWLFIPENILDDARAYVEKTEMKTTKKHHYILGTIAGIALIFLGYIYYLLVT